MDGFAGNLIAEAIGAFVFAGLVALVLKVREDRQWKPVEDVMYSRLGHWISRMFMNAGICLPPENGQRPIRFADAENRIGYHFDGGLDNDLGFAELGDKVIEVFAARSGGSVGEQFFLATEQELGKGIWDWLNFKLRRDLEEIKTLVGRYEQLLSTRHRKLFNSLMELEDTHGLIGNESSPGYLSHGIYALVFRKAKSTADEICCGWLSV